MFTNQLKLNYEIPPVGHIWQGCNDELEACTSRAGT